MQVQVLCTVMLLSIVFHRHVRSGTKLSCIDKMDGQLLALAGFKIDAD